MLKQLFQAFSMTVILTIVCGVIFPLTVTCFLNKFLPKQSAGSLIYIKDKIIGSELIGQSFKSNKYFYARPPLGESLNLSNYGPTNKILIENISRLQKKLQSENKNAKVPVDLVAESASGVDPHITVAACEFQIPRVAKARKISEEALRNIVKRNIQNRQLFIFGEKRINVLKLNLALDRIAN